MDDRDDVWTNEALKEHFDARLIALEQSVNRRFEAIDRLMNQHEGAARDSLIKAEQALNHRLESMNEFRAQILTERQDFARQVDIRLMDEKISDRVTRIERQQGVATGHRTAIATTAGILFSLLAVALGIFWSNQVTPGDVSNQIKSEAPAAVSAQFEDRLHTVESNQQALLGRVGQIEDLDRLICRTRTPTC